MENKLKQVTGRPSRYTIDKEYKRMLTVFVLNDLNISKIHKLLIVHGIDLGYSTVYRHVKKLRKELEQEEQEKQLNDKEVNQIVQEDGVPKDVKSDTIIDDIRWVQEKLQLSEYTNVGDKSKQDEINRIIYPDKIIEEDLVIEKEYVGEININEEIEILN